MMFYQFPVGEKMSKYLQQVTSLGRRNTKNFVTQSLSVEEKQKMQEVLNNR